MNKRTSKNLKFKIIISLIVTIIIASVVIVVGCKKTTTTIEETKDGVSYFADFYDNNGNLWLSVEGTKFDISPNKIKEYYYNGDGKWTYHYTMSSIMSIDVDGQDIESCGGTIIFADSRLKKFDINIPKNIVSSEGSSSADINSPNDFSWKDYYSISKYWKSKDLENQTTGSKIVIIQSQNGDNICMYCGDKVSWDIPNNLPKTTEVIIDGMSLFIHRANFSIIDKSLINKVEN